MPVPRGVSRTCTRKGSAHSLERRRLHEGATRDRWVTPACTQHLSDILVFEVSIGGKAFNDRPKLGALCRAWIECFTSAAETRLVFIRKEPEVTSCTHARERVAPFSLGNGGEYMERHVQWYRKQRRSI